MDGYEQNLLALFESCDDYYQGSLGAAGLQQLCEKLKLEDSYLRLAQYLLMDNKRSRIYFQEFKETLLQLLSSKETTEKPDGEFILDRKYCLKYTDKKYGKKLKHENEDFSVAQINQTLLCSSTNSNSSEELLCKKRKTKSKRKGKHFLNNYGKSDSVSENQETSAFASTMNEVEHLVSAWSNVSRGATDYLSLNELVRVFQCVGLDRDSEEAAQCVFEKLDLKENGRLTLQELLEFIRSGGSWSREDRTQHMELETTHKNASMEFIEPPRLGCITGAYLVERWECAGVPGALQLLQNLGYSPAQQIDVSSLVTLLSEEVNNLSNEFKSSSKHGMDPHVALLQANSVLQNLYIQSLKTTIEHLNAEKEKLRNDVIEANQRAVFLAQEVDDHHSKLEHSTQQQVKVLEQRHAEKIREITSRTKLEQDALVSQNLALEKKVQSLEEEETKNKAIICQLEVEARLSEQEHKAVMDQLNDAQKTKEKLEKQLGHASFFQQRVSEMETVLKETEVVSLLERIRILESENTSLRDRNDELSVEVEELSTKLSNSSTNKRTKSLNMISLDQSVEENVGGGAVKRRGDAFIATESVEDSGDEEESPRLGKVRKCSHLKDFSETTSSFKDLQIHSGLPKECREESCDGEPVFLEVDDDNDCKNENSYQIMPFSKELEQVNGLSVAAPCFRDVWCDDLKDKLKKINKKLKQHDAVLANEVRSAIREIIIEKNARKVNDAEESLRNRCKELEVSLELLKEEYEKTEDYWSEKLEEERSLFEEEQKVNDKKYSELLEKILEYEENLKAEKEQKQRLETIEEKDSFEKQVADMEQECAELKFKLTETLKEKELETERLKMQIEQLKLKRECMECKFRASINESYRTEMDGQETSAESENHNKEIKDLNSTPSGCKPCEGVKSLLKTKLKCQLEMNLMKEEKDRIFKQITERKQKFSNCGGNEKVQELQQKCYTLMITLKQQQKQTEDILKNTWKQHKAEVKDLKSVLRMTEEKLKRQTKVIQDQLFKLAKTDLLVKDLFVENAYLISSVQKLEREYQSCASSGKTSP